MVLKLFLIANMLLNGLTRGQKTVCNWPRPSLEVIQEVRTWGICLKLNSLMNFSFILYLSSFKQFVHCSLVSGCDRYLLKKIFQSLYGSLLNHLFHYTNKNIRSSLYLICITSVCFNYHFTRSKTVQFMEDLAVITAQNR